MDDEVCVGSVLRVQATSATEALQHFDERELINGIYRREIVQVETEAGKVTAYAYVARSDHEQYCGSLPDAEAARLIATASGTRGTSLEYLEQCVAALRRQDIYEPTLERVLAAATAWASDQGAAADDEPTFYPAQLSTPEGDALCTAFDRAVCSNDAMINCLPSDSSERHECKALYYQAIRGNACDHPLRQALEGTPEFQAWAALHGTSKESAMRNFVSRSNALYRDALEHQMRN